MTEIYWQSKQGKILVDNMTESHAKNVLKYLIRNNLIIRERPKTEWEKFINNLHSEENIPDCVYNAMIDEEIERQIASI